MKSNRKYKIMALGVGWGRNVFFTHRDCAKIKIHTKEIDRITSPFLVIPKILILCAYTEIQTEKNFSSTSFRFSLSHFFCSFSFP